MADWKQLLEKVVMGEYAGVTIVWHGDNPELVLPDELIGKKDEIVQYVTAIWALWGGAVEFHPEKAIRTRCERQAR